MHQPFDAFFQLHEGAVTHDVHHRALVSRADRVLLFDLVPRAGRLLLQTQCNLFAFAIDVQNLHFDFLIDRHHFRRMPDAAPAHVGNVQQAIDAAQIDKRAELGNVLYHAGSQLAYFQRFQKLFLLFGPFLFDQGPAANDDVAPRLVDFQHQALNRAAQIIANIGRPANIDLAGRQKHVDAADIDQQARL